MSLVVDSNQSREVSREPQGSLFSVGQQFVEDYGYLLPPPQDEGSEVWLPGAALIHGYTTQYMEDELNLCYRLEQTIESQPVHHWQVLHWQKRGGRPLVEVNDLFVSASTELAWTASRNGTDGKFKYEEGSGSLEPQISHLLGSWHFQRTVQAVLRLRTEGAARQQQALEQAEQVRFEKQANASFTRVRLRLL